MSRQTITLELSESEFKQIMAEYNRSLLSGVNKEIDDLRARLNGTRPAFSREEAATYCGKSLSWFNTIREKTNLPHHMVGGTPMFRKDDLDHILLGGSFDENGGPV